MMVVGTRIQIYIKLDSQVETEGRLDAIIVSDLLIVIVIQLMINNLKDEPTYTGCYNHFHNFLRLFDVLTNFGFSTSETIDNYYL